MANDIKLLGFNLNKMHAEKNPTFAGKLEIKSNINISSIEKEKLSLSKEESVKISFDFLVSYGDLGRVEVSGTMFLLLDQKTTKDLMAGWKNKAIPADLNTTILNVILQKASIKTLEIEDELGLPPHISFPRLQPSEQKK